MTDLFNQYGTYYDLLYREKDYEAEAAYVAKALRATNPEIRRILEFGSGTGRHAISLAQQGFHVVGVERSEQMVATARRNLEYLRESNHGSVKCRQGDIRAFNLGETFDGVVALFHVVSYQISNEDVLQTFTSARRHLNVKGIFLFDVWHGPAVLAERPSVRVKRTEDEKTRLVRIAEPELDTGASAVTVHYTILAESKVDGKITTIRESHPMRYFFPSEIDLVARQTGFQVELGEEFFTGRQPSPETWGVTYLLRRYS
jgi:SAM-dependent methyltransferase